MNDLVIRNAVVVTARTRLPADVAVDAGAIVEVGPELPGGREEIDARGLLLLPGIIDAHVHFNEPGRTHWEGAATGSRALAAGGGTLFFDMPLNSEPCTLTAAAFDVKRAALEAESVIDFALWGGLVPGSVQHMAELAECGVVGFKAFMCDSGLPEFPRADDATLLDGMREAARLGLPVAVHAESEATVKACTAAVTRRDARAFLASRPPAAELEAIERALQLAAESGVKLHIVHISTGRGVSMAAEARAAGVDVSTETCPHYLFFTETDLERLGTVAKCAPPLRSAADQRELWTAVRRGQVDLIASDHSPSEPAMKATDLMSAWGGIAGVQSTLGVLFNRSRQGDLTLEQVTWLLAESPARRFGIPRKGTIAPGYDADLVLIDPAASYTLAADDLRSRHKLSPYVGETFDGVVRRTVRRGETIFDGGRIAPRSRGRFVSPGTRLT